MPYMLESMYLTLIGIASIFLLCSLFSDKYISKTILSGIAGFLFGALAIASFGVEVVYCTTSACSTQTFFQEPVAWILSSMSVLSFIIMGIFIYLIIANKIPMANVGKVEI